MRFFREMFGRSEPPRFQETKSEAAPVWKPKRLDTEIKLKPPENPEAEAHIRTTHVKRVAYGKLVQSPDGPVVRGFEHSGIGKSEGVPDSFKSQPDHYPFGDKQFLPPEIVDAREKNGDTIIKFTKIIDGKEYVVCGRLGTRSEDGKDVKGRLYTEARYAIIPAQDWSVMFIPQLPELLDMQQLTQADSAMKPFEASNERLDQPLKDGWLDAEVQELLRRLVSGKTINVQNWTSQTDKTLETYYYALLCLPESTAREISFGTGVPESKGELRLTTTFAARAENRKIGDIWKDDGDLSLAETYVEELTKHLDEAKTPRDVLKIVRGLPSDLLQKVEKNIFPDR